MPLTGDERSARGDQKSGGGGGRDRGGRGRSGMPSGGGRPDAPSASEFEEEVQVGSDLSAYKQAAASMDKRAPYRLLRFFDVETVNKNTKPKKVRYKVRLWLADPNNENPDKDFLSKAGQQRGNRGSGISGGGGAGGAGLPEDGPPAAGGGGDRGDKGGAGGRGQTGEQEDTSVYVAVADKMLHPSVRDRIAAQRKSRVSKGQKRVGIRHPYRVE